MNDFPRAIYSFRRCGRPGRRGRGRGDARGALSDLACIRILAHRFDEATAAATEASSLNDDHAKAAAAINLAFIDIVEGRMERVHGMLGEIEAAIEAANPTFLAMGLGVIEEVYHWMGDEAKAIEPAERATALAHRLQIKEALLWIDWDLSLMCALLGRYDEAFRRFEAHAELCRRLEDAGFWTARAHNSRGWTYMQLADWEQGERWEPDRPWRRPSRSGVSRSSATRS